MTERRMTWEGPQTKICNDCGVEKPLAEFAKNKAGRFGVRDEFRIMRCREGDSSCVLVGVE